MERPTGDWPTVTFTVQANDTDGDLDVYRLEVAYDAELDGQVQFSFDNVWVKEGTDPAEDCSTHAKTIDFIVGVTVSPLEFGAEYEWARDCRRPSWPKERAGDSHVLDAVVRRQQPLTDQAAAVFGSSSRSKRAMTSLPNGPSMAINSEGIRPEDLTDGPQVRPLMTMPECFTWVRSSRA